MVEETLSDGVRLAQLLASEIDADEGRLAPLSVADADRDVEPTADGALAYTVRCAVGDADPGAGGGTDTGSAADAEAPLLAEVYVQPDRARVEFTVVPEVAAATGEEEGLRVRPKAVRPPRTLVFVEDGAQVKWILPVFERVLEAHRSP